MLGRSDRRIERSPAVMALAQAYWRLSQRYTARMRWARQERLFGGEDAR